MNVCQWHGGQSSVVTNLTTQSLSVEIDPWKQELIYSRLTGSGFLLEGQPLSQAKFSLPSLTAKAENYGAADEAPAGNTELSEASKDYSAFPYMWPKYWMPWVSFVPGGAIFDASTSAKDPLSFHQYFIDVGYDTRAKQPTQTVGYKHGRDTTHTQSKSRKQCVDDHSLGRKCESKVIAWTVSCTDC
jgi:hypothetical protein